MNVYFDTEFTGLVPYTTLISIGMIDENGAKFYAEFTDYNKNLCDIWIKENVLANLIFKRALEDLRKAYADGNYDFFSEDLAAAGIADDNERNMFVRGSSDYIRDKLRMWIEEIPERVQLISDIGHYDMTLLCNLFGGAFELPKNVNPVCYDICQDFCMFKILKNGLSESDIMKKSFDMPREEVLTELGGTLPSGSKHNALYDAEVIKGIYERMRKRI